MRKGIKEPKTYETLRQLQCDNEALYNSLFKEKNLSPENEFDVKLMELVLIAEGKIKNPKNKR